MKLKDLAKLCNVSVSTVSKAFCDADDIGDETKEMIFEMAKKNGCYEKYYKGRYHKFVVAVICPEVNSDLYANFLNELQKAIAKVGGITVIAADGFDKANRVELVEYFASKDRADGIIAFYLDELKKGYDVPIINIGKDLTSVDSVNTDIKSALNDAVRHLKELGHRKIAFLGETLTEAKLKSFKDAMIENNIYPDDAYHIVSQKRFEDAGVWGAEKILKECPDCTAVVCAYDYIAIGAMKCFESHGLRVPEDYSVVGMDNIGRSEYLIKSLTTIDSHLSEVCSILADLMAKKVKCRFITAKQQIRVSADLVIRESTGKARY